MIGVPFDTLCDLLGPKGERHSNKPCKASGSTIPSAPKATSTLKSVNGSSAPPLQPFSYPSRIPKSRQNCQHTTFH